MQIPETFKFMREILTQQLVPRQIACSSKILFFVRGNADHHY